MTINEYQGLAMRTVNADIEKKDMLVNSVMGMEQEPKILAQKQEVLMYTYQLTLKIGVSLSNVLIQNYTT